MSHATPDTSSTPVTRSRRELVAWRNAIFAIFFLSGLSMATWVARIPAVRDDAHLALVTVGFVILGMSIGSVIGLIAAPWMMARLGARRSMMVSLFIVSVGLVIVGIGSTVFGSLPVLIIGMALLGFGNGSVDVAMNVEGALAERANGKTLMPLMHAFFSFGTAAGAGIGVLASAIRLPVLWNFSIVAVLVAIAIVVAVRFVPVDADAEDTVADAPSVPWRERVRENLSAWGDVRLLLIGVIMLGMSFAEGGANDWVALAVVDGHGGDNTFGAVVFGVFTISMTVARVLGGPVLDRFGRVPVLRVCAAIGIVGLSLFIWGSEPWMYITGTVLWALGCALGFPVGMSAAADDPKRAAARVSAVAIIGYCAFLAGPPLLGFLGQHFGILNALIVLLVLMVASGIAAPAAREQGTRAPRA
ncbi:MFS transporter [Glaciibacter flavus]|uniref:MFS transporter n=1 Tax=Orlajensenia flava TaxID=2565934 RepID=A0A4S4FRW2_9MICO|nr:MFS transporter [Glaciibacter flavus]THG32622.1 MFS transporter [Glaciibacter flavus]